jgi:nucleoside-triphosphatase THEP1
MELLSKDFYQAVQEILASRVTVVGTIVQRFHPLADPIKRHPRVQLRSITRANREQVPRQIEAEFGEWLNQP